MVMRASFFDSGAGAGILRREQSGDVKLWEEAQEPVHCEGEQNIERCGGGGWSLGVGMTRREYEWREAFFQVAKHE